MPQHLDQDAAKDAMTFLPFPEVTEETISQALSTGNYRTIAFEYFKNASLCCIVFACIETASPALRSMPKSHLAVIRGNLSRIGHLCKNVLQLAHDGDSYETVAMLNRSIIESATYLRWCLREHSEERVHLFIEAGLQADIELKESIEANIAARGGEPILLEKRMLGSIERVARLSGVRLDAITRGAKLPKMNVMLKQLGDEDLYFSIQRIGSQSVHGTWSELVLNYLVECGDELVPRDLTRPTPDVSFLFPAMLILDALVECSKFCFQAEEVQSGLIEYFAKARDSALTMIQHTASDEFIGHKRRS